MEEGVKFAMRLLQKIEEREKCTFSNDSKILIRGENYQHKAHYFGKCSDLIFSMKRFSETYDH